MNGDNKFGKCCKCPGIGDNRLFTSWVPNITMNEYIKSINKISDSNEYRMFLQQNAEKIMQKEQSYLEANKKCDFTLFPKD